MKGDAKVIELLNEALKNELTAVNQYWLHYRLLDNWGMQAPRRVRAARIDRRDEACRQAAERILFLDGLPNFQMLGRLRIGEKVEEILRADLELELEAVDAAEGRDRAIARASATMSAATCSREILANEEEHVDTLETAVRHDRADGPAELHPAPVEAGRGLTPRQAR